MRSYNATSPADWSAAGAWHTVPWSPVHGLHGVAAGATGPGAGNSSGSTGDSRDSTDISSAAFGGHSPAASTTPSQDGPGSRSGTTSAAPSTPTSPTSPTSFTSTAPTATTAPDLGPSPIGWLKSGIPYLPPTDALQLHTLDVWVPNHDNTNVPPDPLSPSSPSEAGGTWIVYIHGGAWRDPFITSASFAPAAGYLLHHAAEHAAGSGAPPPLAGLVSINYRLSPHPSHPAPRDPSRQARHPDHIADVLAALSFLGRVCIIKGGAVSSASDGRDDNRAIGEKLAPSSEPAPETNWILAGHSCGATLAFQAVMHPARWKLSSSSSSHVLPPPRALVGFNGLYDLAGFVAAPPLAYAHLRDAYREFTTAAFGGDEDGWRAVCPASAGGQWVQEWVRGGGKQQQQQQQEGKKAAKNKWSLKVVVEYLVKMILGGTGSQRDGKKAADKETKKASSAAVAVTKPPTKKSVVLVQSREDSLVPWDQIDAMHARLADEGGVNVTVVESDGDHDDAWKKGGRMADILWGVVSEKV